MLSNESREDLSKVTQMSKGNRDVIAFGLAKVIANHLPVPSAQVDIPGEYYNDNNVYQVDDIVNFINELCVVDTERVVQLTKNLWLTRVNVVFCKRKLFKLADTTPGFTFFNVSGRLSKVELDFIATNEVAIIDVHNVFFQVLQELDLVNTVNTVTEIPIIPENTATCVAVPVSY